MRENRTIILFSRYSLIDVLSVINLLHRCDLVLFMPKIFYQIPHIHSSNLKKKLVKITIYIFNMNVSIEEIDIDEITGEHWGINVEAAEYIASKKKEFIDSKPVRFLDSILKDSTVVNYFQASIVHTFFYQMLFSKLINEYKQKFTKVYWVGRVLDKERGRQNKTNLFFFRFLKQTNHFFITFKYLTITCLIPFYFLFRHILHGFVIKPKKNKPLLTMPVIQGVFDSVESPVASMSPIKGVKTY